MIESIVGLVVIAVALIVYLLWTDRGRSSGHPAELDEETRRVIAEHKRATANTELFLGEVRRITDHRQGYGR